MEPGCLGMQSGWDKMKEFKIENRVIGTGHSPLIIPEIGINHEGKVEKAFQMIDDIATAGGEIVKFQCHITEKEMLDTGIQPPNADVPLWDIIKRCELTAAEERDLFAYAREKKLLFLSTPFSREAADQLEGLGVSAYKIGSGECNNIPLLKHVASFGKPIILSTGMNDLDSIKHSVNAILTCGVPLALLHCVSLYPTPYDQVRLKCITELQDEFPDLNIGLSDHSIGIWTGLGSVALGATIIEKHFTSSKQWPGPDIEVSIDPEELHQLIIGSNAIWKSLKGGKHIVEDEKPVIDFAYASVVSIDSIAPGDELSMENIWVKRPGTGPFLAKDFEMLLGKRAKTHISNDEFIRPEMLID